MKYIQNILLAILGLVLIFTMALTASLKDRITVLETKDYSNITASTITVPTSATTTENLPVTELVATVLTHQAAINFFAQDFCIKNPNTEGCTTASTTVK